jgi:hypothetical protein
MVFKLISKNNIGVVATLILVILLSQSRVFDLLIDTTLGRAILILFILGISYTNQILGVVAVLFIVIIFNQSNIGYLEGFTNEPTIKDGKIKENKDKKQNSLQTGTTKSITGFQTPSITTSTSEKFIGHEGFNMIDREGTMLRGKRSGEVPVFSNARTQNEDIEPTDKSVFTNSYSKL